MKNTSISAELRDLISNRTGLCASIIVPVHGIPSEKQVDKLAIDHAVAKLNLKLQANENPHTDQLVTQIKELSEQAKEINGENGVGIFVNDKIARLCTFPFEVREKVHLADSFEVRDLVQKERYTKEYFVLHLGGHSTRLFKAKEKQFREFDDVNFPATFDGIDHEMPAQENQGSSAAQAMKREKDTTTQSAEAFYNLVDQKLLDYVSNNSCVIVAGSEKELARYTQHTCHKSKIKGQVTGSYDARAMPQLEKKAWDAFKRSLQAEEAGLLGQLRECSRDLMSAGLPAVWSAVHQGKTNVLLVEMDLRQKAYKCMDEFNIESSPSRHGQPLIEDAVDDVIECALEKNGRVVFVPNGSLQEYGGIAVINRY